MDMLKNLQKILKIKKLKNFLKITLQIRFGIFSTLSKLSRDEAKYLVKTKGAKYYPL